MTAVKCSTTSAAQKMKTYFDINALVACARVKLFFLDPRRCITFSVALSRFYLTSVSQLLLHFSFPFSVRCSLYYVSAFDAFFFSRVLVLLASFGGANYYYDYRIRNVHSIPDTLLKDFLSRAVVPYFLHFFINFSIVATSKERCQISFRSVANPSMIQFSRIWWLNFQISFIYIRVCLTDL